MKIIVCTGQSITDSQTEAGRAGLEAALRLKKLNGAFVSFLCLGGESSMAQIREAIAMGCDEGTLLLYPESEYLDASACATVLSSWLEGQEYDVLISSCCTTAADTIHIGLLAAGMLKIPAAIYVQEIRPLQQSFLWIKQQLGNCSQKLRILMPCLLCVLPEREQHFYMDLEGIAKAYNMSIPTVNADEMLKQKGIAPARNLVKICQDTSLKKKPRKKGRILSVPVEQAVSAIMDLLVKNHILDTVQKPPVYFTCIENQIELLEVEMLTETYADITQARVIVAGGRGIGSAEGFKELHHIAGLLGGAVACSRACVESGWVDAALQVGQSGKTVMPDCYLACGISGAFQHVTGMAGSKLVISINKNPTSPIFDISDLGIIGNVEDILPRLTEALEKYNNVYMCGNICKGDRGI